MFRLPALLLGLLLAAGCSTVPSPQRAALKSAEGFVRGLQDARVRVDDFWFLHQVLRHRPDWASASVFARSAADRFPGDPYLRLLDLSHQAEGLTFSRVDKGEKDWPYRIPAPYARLVYTAFDRVFLRALYCDYGDYTAEDLAILQSVVEGNGSYADTHALMALLFVAEQKPDLATQTAPQVAELCRILAAAQDQAERFDDVYVERIVFLYWAGHGHLVQQAWLDRLVSAQRPDGAWGSEASQGHNLHTTGLAILALLYAAEGQPAQPLYAP